MTDISQLPSTLQAIGLGDLGVISQSTTIGVLAVKAPLSAIVAPVLASPGPIGSVAPNTGAFTTASVGTSFLIGGPSLTGLPYSLQSATSTDPSAAGASGQIYRPNAIQSALTYTTQDTTNIWENFISGVFVSGPHVANGEVNALHGYIQINAGASATQSECVEASMQNLGTVGTWDGFLSIANNTNTGTVATGLNGYLTELTNSNTTAASVTRWIGFCHSPMQGGGSVPTGYWAFNNSDSLASMTTSGGMVIGGASTQQQVGPGTLLINGANNSAGSFPLNVKSLSGSNLLLVDNAGDVTMSGNLAVSGPVTGSVLKTTQLFTVATLPTASSGLKGDRAMVSDATAPTFLGTLTGGGAVTCPVFCNGTTWVPG